VGVGGFGEAQDAIFQEGEEAGGYGGIVAVARDRLVAGAGEVVGGLSGWSVCC